MYSKAVKYMNTEQAHPPPTPTPKHPGVKANMIYVYQQKQRSISIQTF